MASSYTPLLGFVLPVTGELAGTWGTVWNNEGTSLLDSSIAGTTTLSTDADVTLTTTTGASNQARQAILLCSGARTALRTITAPAQSKIYVVINNTTGGFGVVIRGVGPTTGVTVAAGRTVLAVWNGSDFVELAPATATTATNLTGGVAGSVPYQTAASTTTFLGIGAQYRVLTSTGSAPQWTTELRNLTLLYCDGNISARSMTVHPSLSGKIGSNDLTVQNVNGGICSIGLPTLGSGLTTLVTLNFVSSGSIVRGGIACAEEGGAEEAGLGFSTRNAAGSVGERMKITSAGNVGIGTASPAKLLDLAANNTGITTGDPLNTLRFTDTDTTSAAGQPMGRIEWYSADTDTAGVKAYIQAQSVDATPDADMVFATNHVAGGGTAERMRIQYDGNVGIGTTSPVNKLQINGSLGRNAPVTKTTSFTLAATENWLICNGTATITVTFPAASSWTGREVMIKTIAAFTVVSASSNVVPLAGGAAGTAILPATAGAWATLVSDGTNWIIMQS